VIAYSLMNCRSMLARDLQSIVLYDEEGKFAGVRRPNSKLPIEINGTQIIIEDAIGSTGLDLKVSSSSRNDSHFWKTILVHLCGYLRKTNYILICVFSN
jgi:hypothetical protein